VQFDVPLEIKELGYLFVYLSYDNNQSTLYLYYDDFKITVDESPLIQVNNYYPFGMVSNTWLREGEQNNANLFQGKELISQTGWHDFGSRMYWADIGRWMAIDPEKQFISPYLAMANAPVMGVDPDGKFFWFALPLIAKLAVGGAALFGTGNLVAKASNGEINNFGDALGAFGSGALAGAAIGVGIGLGLGVPVLNTVIKGAGWMYAGSTGMSVVSGLGNGLINGDWTRLENTGKILLGNFNLDENRNFLEQTWEGISRFSWELPQTAIGYSLTQVRNTTGGVDRVDFFGGATFATSENNGGNRGWGISLGNFINMSIPDQITGSFKERILSDPLFMHEYGHRFDSHLFGLGYLPFIGVPSLYFAINKEDGWTERRANRHAADYFGRHFGIDWSPFSHKYPLKK